MRVNFGRIMKATAEAYADREALVNIESGRRFTFMELHLLTNRICNMMRDKFELADGDVYATLLVNDDSSLFSLWMSKGLPTGFWMDYGDSFANHVHQLDYVKPKVVFIQNALLDKYFDVLRERGIKIVCVDPAERSRDGVCRFWDELDGVSDAETDVEYDYESHIIVFRFTGGTTGAGKCVMYTLRNVLDAARLLYEHPENYLNDRTRFLHITPITHGTVFGVLPVFFKGGSTLTLNGVDIERACQAIQAETVTSTFMVPTLLYRLESLETAHKCDLSSLETVFYGAAPMSSGKLELLQERFGNVFVQAYGASEAFPPLSLLGKHDHILSSEEAKQRISSAGRPMPGVEMMIVDDSGHEVPRGSLGEIWIRGTSVVSGYYGDPELTSKEFSAGDYWKSGDIGYADAQGYIYIVDRKKDMIISGGYNVYAAEVEGVLNSHPAVQEAAVVGIPHDDWGECVHAEVVLRKNASASESEIISYCKERLGRYKSPKSVVFVDQLPMSAVGKVLHRQVKQKYWTHESRGVH